MGMYEKFTPVIQLDEITSVEEGVLEDLAAISFAAGDIIYYNGADLVKLAIGSSGQVLNVSGGIPAWGSFGVSGGGTGLTSMTAYAVLTGGVSTTGALQQINGLGSSGQVLTSNGAGSLPTWQSGGAAPTAAQYVVLSANGTLSDERILTGTADQIVVTDNGAGNSVALSLPQSINTTSSPTFNALTVTSIIIGANTITTSEWANLDGLNQTLATTSSPTFNAGTFTSIIIGANTITTSEWAFLDGLNQAVSTTSNPQFVTIELGHATDTTIARSGAGAITVEGVQVILSGAALGTPASGTLTNCTGLPVAGLVALTASEIVITTAGGVLASAAVATYPSLTELTYVKGVTSAIQTQINTKVTSGGALGTPSSGTGTNITGIPAANILAGSFGAGAYVISTSLQATTIELGHATDTTLARVSAGVVSIEGVNILTTAGGTLTGNINLGEAADPADRGIVVDSSLSADERYSGITIPGTAGATIAFGDICYLDVTAGEWLLADASAATTAGNVPLGICVDASTDGAATSMLILGTVRSAAFPASVALGAPLYVSETAGDITATAPVTTDSVMRIVGYAITVEPNTIYFNPENDYITHT